MEIVETGDRYRDVTYNIIIFKTCQAFRNWLVHEFYCMKAGCALVDPCGPWRLIFSLG